MKNILLALTTLGLGFLAHADKNDCFYKGEHKKIEYVVDNSSCPPSSFCLPVSYYYLRLDEDLEVSVGKQQGHSAIYTLSVKYKSDEVVVSDTYADFLDYRDLYVEMRIKGSLLACEFSPNF